jgi:transposase
MKDRGRVTPRACEEDLPGMTKERIFMTISIGIDIGLTTSHTAVIMKDGRRCGRAFSVATTREGMDELARRVEEQRTAADEAVSVVLEATGHAWVTITAELQRRGMVVWLPSAALAMQKRSRAEAKSDSKDAERLASHVFVQPERLNLAEVADPVRRSLKLVLSARRRVVEESVQLQTAIWGHLQLLHPTLGKEFSRLNQVERALLKEKLDPFAVVAKGEAALRRFCEKHARCPLSDAWFDAVWKAYRTAHDFLSELRKAGKMPVEIDDVQWTIAELVDALEAVQERDRAYQKRIEALYARIDPTKLLENTVPGVGPLVAATIEAHVGDIERFQNIKAFVKYVGIAPGSHRSGKTIRDQPITKTGANILKKHLYLAAEVARRTDPTLAALYSKAVARHHRHAVIVVAHALARRIYALLKERAAVSQDAPAEEPIEYQYVAPDGRKLSHDEARAYISEHFPPGEAKRRREGGRPTSSPSPKSREGTAGSPQAAPS